VGDSLASSAFNFADNIRGIHRVTAVIAKIVHYDFRAAFCKRQCVTSPESLTRARDNSNLTVKSDAHLLPFDSRSHRRVAAIMPTMMATFVPFLRYVYT
jgi:hypothetical protein